MNEEATQGPPKEEPFRDGDSKNVGRWWLIPLIGVVMSIAVTGPWLRHGWLLLLDSVSGPHPDIPRTVYGLDGGVTQALPAQLLFLGLGRLIGPRIITWLPFFIFFPLAMWSMSRLV